MFGGLKLCRPPIVTSVCLLALLPSALTQSFGTTKLCPFHVRLLQSHLSCSLLNSPIPNLANGVYTYSMKKPWWGWTGFLLEAVFAYNYADDPLNPSRQIRVTTEVNVVPDILPFPPCGNNCQPPTGAQAKPTIKPKFIKKRF